MSGQGADAEELRTLVLERGRDVKHGDNTTAMKESWEFAGRNRLSTADVGQQARQARTGYTTHPASAHWFVNDVENPYSEAGAAANRNRPIDPTAGSSALTKPSGRFTIAR